MLIADAGNFTSYNRREGPESADCMLKCMSKVGYDVLGVSNKDLNNGIELLKNAERNYGINFVCANLYDKQTKRPIFHPYVIKKKAGLKIGVFGLTEELYWRDQALNDSLNIDVQTYREICPQIVKKVRPKVDYLVLLTDLRTNSLDSLMANNPGIDLVVTTGSYKEGVSKISDSRALVVGTGSRGMNGTLLEIPFDPQYPDTLIYREAQAVLTDEIASDSLLAALIVDCKPKPAAQTYVPRQPTNTSLNGVNYQQNPGKDLPNKGENIGQIRKQPLPKPVTRTIPPAESTDKDATTK